MVSSERKELQVDGRPELPEAIKAGILAMVEVATD
jgi:hypothetical protein